MTLVNLGLKQKHIVGCNDHFRKKEADMFKRGQEGGLSLRLNFPNK